MAVASAWSKPGSWALDSEANESTDLTADPPLSAAAAAVPAADFPSLAAAAAATKAPKKKKPQTISLADFNTGKFTAPASRGPTPDELLNLPTGPRERSAEELERIGSLRGFGAYRGGDASSGSRWGQGRGSDEPRRGGSGGSSREFTPSRADEVDDWGAGKKTTTMMPERRERMGGFGDSHSRADEVDDWGAVKKTAVPIAPERRERGGGFGDSHSRADESANWVSNKSAVVPPPPVESRRSAPGWGFNRDSGPDTDSWGRKREEVSNGVGGSGGRPRLVLQPRTLPLANGSNTEKEKQETAAKSKGANPFGVARPREEVLAAKGEDWRKIDEKLEALKVREAPPERSFGRRGAGAENGNGDVPESRAERAWRKADAVEAPAPGSEGLEIIEESVPEN